MIGRLVLMEKSERFWPMAVGVSLTISVAGAIATTFLLFGFSLDWAALLTTGEGLSVLGCLAASTFVVQMLLLLEAPKIELRRKKKSVWASVLVGSGVFAALMLGVLSALANVADVWKDYATGFTEVGIYFLMLWWMWSLPLFLIGLRWPEGMGQRIYRALVAGTVLELLIAIPIDAYVRKRTQCYCGEGTFIAMAIGMSAAVALTGPAVVILMLARRELVEKRRAGLVCRTCGYDLRMLPGAKCPECGTAFEPKKMEVR